MKKRRSILRAGISTLLIFGSSILMGSCNAANDTQQTVQEAVLSSIEVTRQPDKTQYYEEDSFDNTGMLVKAHYSDQTSKLVGAYKFSREPLKLTDTNVTLSYTEKNVTKTTTVAITVNALEKVSIRADGVGSGRNKRPIKVDYHVGERFDTSTMVVYLRYNSGREDVVPVEDYTYTPNGPLALTDTKITVSHLTFTCEVAITVTAA